ncbi:MAG: hypothetical protein ACFFG0_24685 [Candidatus Thorarchaeota archaeon]
MKTVSIKKDFKEMNLSNSITIEKLIKQFKVTDYNRENEIKLDLSGCITDYPHTPYLIDFFLDILSKQNGSKKLFIKYTGIGTNELHVLYDLVLEGIFFGIKKESQVDNNLSNWKLKIKNKLSKNNMELTILCPLDKKEYHYGK